MKTEYANLDFLRTFAVTLVTACHVGMFYINAPTIIGPLGALGVNLFFVHTCLVLMQSLERQDKDGSSHLFRDFITRRFFRIYPLSVIVILAVLLFNIPSCRLQIGHINPMKLSLSSILSNLTLTQSFFILVPSIVAPMWSLSFEVEMYLLLPALYRLTRGRYAVPVLYAGALAISSLLLYFYPYETRYSFLSLFQYVPCFMPGIMAFWLSKKITPRFPAYLWVLLLFTLTGIVVSGWVPIASEWLPGWGRWWVPILVGFAIPGFKQLTGSVITSTSRIIAKYSYGVYVAHYFCIWAGLEKIGHRHPVLGPIAFCVLLAAITVTLYHAVEKPFINLGKRLTRPAFKQKFLLPALSEEGQAPATPS